MVDLGALEKHYGGNAIEGSNPSLSAKQNRSIFGSFLFVERSNPYCAAEGSVEREHAPVLVPSMLERRRPKADIPPSPPNY